MTKTLFSKLKLRVKLLCIIFISCFAALLLVTIIGIIGQYNLARNQLTEDMLSLVKVMAENSKAGLAFQDKDNIQTIINSFVTKDEILLAQIYTIDNALFTEYKKTGTTSLLSKAFAGIQVEKVWFEQGIAGVTWPVTLDNEIIGHLHLQQEMANLRLSVSLLSVLMLIALVIGLLFAYLLSNYLLSAVIQPLSDLAETMDQVSITKDYSLRAEIIGQDEIGTLANGFNYMIEQIEYRDDQLEEEVEKRTKDLVEAKDAAEAASKAKSIFLANMSHEIRTPMTAIVGMTDLALSKIHNYEQRRIIGPLKGAADTLLGILNDILDFSKIEAGQLELTVTPFNLNATLQSVIDTMQGAAVEKGLSLELSTSDHISSGYIGDDLRIRQILYNLISNAIKFTNKGYVRVSAEVAEETSGLHVIEFRVKDSGKGISGKDQENIFNYFEQIDSSYDRKAGGTGIGLSISKQLIELMGGEIKVASKEGFGAVFSFTLNLKPCAIEDAVEGGALVNHGARLSGLKILIVDDNEANRDLTSMVLEEDNDVMTAVNGLDALNSMLKAEFDVILMDVQMPVMDGLAATKAIRALEKGEGLEIDLPDGLESTLSTLIRGKHHLIVAMTAHAMSGDKELCLKAGMDEYLTKPFRPDQLITAIKHEYTTKSTSRFPDKKTAPMADTVVNPGRQTLHPARIATVASFLKSEVYLSESKIPMVLQVIGKNLNEYLDDAGAALIKKDFECFAELLHKVKGVLLQCGLIEFAEFSQYLYSSANERKGIDYSHELQVLRQSLSSITEAAKDDQQSIVVGVYSGKSRVLLMDDEPMVCNLGKEMFEMLGHDTDTAIEGSSAVEMYRKAYNENNSYKVVITDINIMNGMGGVETAAKILEIDQHATLIACSGDHSCDEIVNYQQYGFAGTLIKPFLIENVKRVLAGV